jgi:molybdate transport system substrate-binding protein
VERRDNDMSAPITLLSSKATRVVLAELARIFEARSGRAVALQSLGGVTAARRVGAGEVFDVVALASHVIDELLETRHLVAGSKVDVVRSGVAVAVRAGAIRPKIDSEDALKHAVIASPTIGISTGPSGRELTRLFEHWGLSEALRGRVVVAPPGIPVATLVARGEAALGFQQESELFAFPGIDVLGPMPAPIQIVTTFSAALCATSQQPDEARALLAFMTSPEAANAKRDQGMEPARSSPAENG